MEQAREALQVARIHIRYGGKVQAVLTPVGNAEAAMERHLQRRGLTDVAGHTYKSIG